MSRPRGLLAGALPATVVIGLVGGALATGGCRGTTAGDRGPAPAGATVPGLPSRARLRVRGLPQRHSLSCESRSACDLLGYLGRPTDEDAFLSTLPRSDNPDLGFVGDVDGPGEQLPPAGYGVHAEPVAAALRARGVAARAVRGSDLGCLRSEVAAGRPVLVWATARLEVRTAVTARDARGRPYVAVRGEHTLLVVGYGPGTIDLLDPATGETRSVPATRFDAAWALLDRQAILVQPVPAR